MRTNSRVEFFGTHFSKVDLETATRFLINTKFKKPEYVCFPSTGTISIAYKDKEFQNILNNSFLTLVDGKFTEFYLRIIKKFNIRNVSGYWLLENLLQTDFTHFFYGCDEPTLKKLRHNLRNRFPSAKILGFRAPPFVELSKIYPNQQIINDFHEINKLKPDFIWIGISTPKQDYLLHYYNRYLDKGVMLGVGAVLLYHSGVENKGPEIFKKFGLRWVLRLSKNPKRILQRKVLNNWFLLLFLIIKHDLFRFKR